MDKLIICSDHAGFDLKAYLLIKLRRDKIDVIDIGVYNKVSTDYPDIISKGAKVISKGEYNKGIFICGSGIGATIVANRFKNVRAGLVYNKKIALLSRLHNDTNVIVFGSRLIRKAKAYKLFKIWYSTEFKNEERHLRRIQMIESVI